MTTSHETTPVLPLPTAAARAAVVAGGVLAAASALMSWTWTADFPGDLTYYGSPAGLQWLALVGGLLTVLLALAAARVPGLRWLSPSGSNNGVLFAAIGTLAVCWYAVVAIAAELGGLANLDPGGWVAGVGSLLAVAGALGLPLDRRTTVRRPTERWWAYAVAAVALLVYFGLDQGWLLHAIPTGVQPILTENTWFFLALPGLLAVLRLWLLLDHWLRIGRIERRRTAARALPSWAEILVITAVFAVGLAVADFGISTEYGELFIGFLLLVAAATAALNASGAVGRLAELTTRHRAVTTGAAFAAAAAFPFTQGSDTYVLIGVNILIFATVALGLNVVVGLAGLLDLGYVAFLGVGAYAAALVSGSPFSAFRGVHLPFPLAALVGALAALVFGVVIGAPTLRLRGDYLAIVTLGFGEIFRIAMNNLDGSSGPSLTNGPNGIAAIPDVSLFGFDFGQPHDVLGLHLGKFGNYLLLMLVATAIVVTVFGRVANSRIGRAWVAIREDETAAEAMGINGFRVKLIAFALGATLAGLAGAVQAHVASAVSPDQYQFAGAVPPNSAFLLAAVILGGMGTISGPLVGAALLFLIPAKLQFLQSYQLLAFGVALILLMRFRPEGLIAGRRQQLEFHEADAELPAQAAPIDDVPTKAGA
ncbi:branched-chain amino acid transport system permease protein [Kitasatospora sp. SolWspMP-SS2h]|uniref:branched-chain amino acid ABC transporter permease n=1 Tax=Kitasatospora sp. SolWspMP-SS2h TaxID=1305729 RepID=UPI000DB9AB38|nr:branched-chain amino acid ABC transporter permease [Kitasatospora sp. SolWspMP-SS2h]RAJ43725.1 branched-chain amino acid transport system permease protein [Kitasatospora sp. SolWspMP-SS2h]